MRFLILALSALTLMSCKDLDILRYEYHTSTMMGRTVLSVTQDSVIVTFNGRGEPTYYGREVNATEWKALNESMKNVDLAEVSKLEAPSNGRATDRAAYAKFKFINKEGELVSSEFDGGNPHEMLKPLMAAILAIEAKNEK